MNSRSWMVAGFFGAVLLVSNSAQAQTTDFPSPTVVPARHSASFSPYTASTTPLSSVSEGVTTYYWPTSSPVTTSPATSAPQVATKVASVAPLSFSPTMYEPSESRSESLAPPPAKWTPVQTTLRPLPPVVTQQPIAGNMNCVCQPAGQAPTLAPQSTYFAPQPSGYAQYGYPPVNVYRPAMPVSQMPGDYYFGYGLIGQPKVYVPGQPVRNALRFISP